MHQPEKNKLNIGGSVSRGKCSLWFLVSSFWLLFLSKQINNTKENEMTKEEFLSEMQDVLQTDDTLTAETVLGDLAEWDSLSMMATMAFLDKNFGVKVGLKDF